MIVAGRLLTRPLAVLSPLISKVIKKERQTKFVYGECSDLMH